MTRSTDRILTTHTGSLPRTAKVVELLLAEDKNPGARRDELLAAVREAVKLVVNKQVEAGVDIVNDGEQGRTDYTVHVLKRLTGFEGESAAPMGTGEPEFPELSELLKLGCAKNKTGGLTLPWYFEQDFGAADQTMSMMVTGEGVPLLESPEEDAPVLAAISWDVVRIATLKPDDDFQRVEAKDGTSGYVATDKLRSLIDYRLLASSRNGRWRIVSLVSGD